jgi:hypothetical protein
MRWTPFASSAFVGRAMRVRGVVSSAGAGASLVAAGLVCLVVVSGLLVFRDWPGSAKRDDDGTLALRLPAVPAAPAAKGGGSTAAGPRPARVVRRVAAARPARAAAPRRVPARRAPRPVRARGNAPAPSVSAPPAATPAPAAPTPATPVSAPATQPRAAKPAAPGPVRNVVDTTRDVVAPVTAAAPAPVQQPVDQVLDTVEQTAGAVDELVSPLLKP